VRLRAALRGEWIPSQQAPFSVVVVDSESRGGSGANRWCGVAGMSLRRSLEPPIAIDKHLRGFGRIHERAYWFPQVAIPRVWAKRLMAVGSDRG
jgi:hypothetical protein